MSFLIDTDICSAYLRGHSAVASRFFQYTGRLYISVVTIAELTHWINSRNTPARFLAGFASLIDGFEVVDVDRPVADLCGNIAAQLSEIGKRPALPDMLIAATALVHDLTVVTHNVRDFHRVPGLRIQDWIAP
jgi:tRNA(fMet)-specific endonuclease VapC